MSATKLKRILEKIEREHQEIRSRLLKEKKEITQISKLTLKQLLDGYVEGTIALLNPDQGTYNYFTANNFYYTDEALLVEHNKRVSERIQSLEERYRHMKEALKDQIIFGSKFDIDTLMQEAKGELETAAGLK